MWYIAVFAFSGLVFSVNESLLTPENANISITVEMRNYQVRQEEKTHCYWFGDSSLLLKKLGGQGVKADPCPKEPKTAKVVSIVDSEGTKTRACCEIK
jgi:hypothetical protein